MAGGAAIFEIDIKKIIALSTLSQLGAIMIVWGQGAPFYPIFTSYLMPFLRRCYLCVQDWIIIIGGIRLVVFAVMVFATFLTVIYSCRLRFLVGIGGAKSEPAYQIIEGDKPILAGGAMLLPFSLGG